MGETNDSEASRINDKLVADVVHKKGGEYAARKKNIARVQL